MRRQAVSLITLVAAAPLVLAGVTHAQTAEPVELDEIVLSATRTPEAASRTGVSVSVVAAEELDKAGDLQLADYLARLPGIGVVQSGPAGTQANLRIRGAEPRYVAVYVDGIRVDDPTGIASEFDFGAMSTADIGRIEVLRGSQSALWGASAVGGVINITSRKALKEGLSQEAAIEGGSHGTLAARYGLGYKTDKVETTFTLSHRKTDGFSAFDTLPPNPALEADGMQATRLSFGTRYTVSDSFAFGVNGFAQTTEHDYDGWGADAANTQKRREWGARLFGEWVVGNSTHVLDVTRYRISRDQFAAGAPAGSFDGVRSGIGYQGTTEISPAFTLVYGADSSKETAVNASLPGGGGTRISGAFVQGLFKPTDTLDLSASLRRDHNSRFGGHDSGRVAVAWQAAPGLTLRGAASTGFRAPSLYEQYGDPTWGIAGNAAGLTPEKSRSFEIGADYALAGGASLGVTLFHIDVDNAITYCGAWANACVTPLPVGFTNLYENLPGRSKRRGLELSGSLPLGARADLALAYTYTDARNPAGTRLARVPRHALALTLDGKLSDRLSGQVSLRHSAGRTDVADFTVVNAGISYDLTAETALSLRVENLFDTAYQTVPAYGTSGRAVYVGVKTSF